MKQFLDKDFLLNTETAKKLYHEAAEGQPIIDYHCHLNPREIWEDIRYENITQVWLGGDHYKWRLMRSAGVPEKYVTGDAGDWEKFEKYAEVLGKAIGNPLYHWSHLELRRFFGYEGILNKQTAKEVWDLAKAKLQEPGYSARGLIMMSHVDTICTTDDPADTLEWHEKLAADKSFPVTVLPAWRPDKAMNLEKSTYPEYIAQLETAAGMKIATFTDLKAALHNRLDFFAAHGCKLSDHGLNYVVYAPAEDAEIEEIFRRRMEGTLPTAEEEAKFKCAYMTAMAAEYRERNWVMQLHYGCRRDNNPVTFRAMGPDTGFDCVDNYAPSAQTAAFLGALEEADKLTARKKALENRMDGLKTWLLMALGGEKLSTPRCKVYQTHNQRVVIDDEKALIDMFLSSPSGEKFLRMKDPEIDKTALKDSMKQGYEFEFAHLEETESVVIE